MTGADLDTLAERLGAGPTDTFADLGGGALDLALAAIGRWDSEVYLIDLTRRGRFPDSPSDWIAPYLAALEAAGADMGRVHLVSSLSALKPFDIVANVGFMGDSAKVRHLEPVLTRALHADSRMVMDIRKGSGSFSYLKDFGRADILWRRSEDGEERTRVIFTPDPPATGAAADWAGIARGLAGPEGFFRENAEHSFLFIPRDKTLVVTFDNLDIAMGKREDRRPWGFSFIEKQGWSMLGVMANGWTWYRDPWVDAQFDRLRDEGFFARFDRVVFYGASMGGYAACAFAAASPGADVVAISPQSTLDRRLVPWETRYKTAWGRDFSGPYGDAAVASRAAGRVSILYDPYEPLDRGHALRFEAPNVAHLRTPLLGHRLGSSLSQMGILTPVILKALAGTLEPVEFYRLLRARHRFPRYQKELFRRAVARGRPGLARKVGDWVLRQGENRLIRQEMARLCDLTVT